MSNYFRIVVNILVAFKNNTFFYSHLKWNYISVLYSSSVYGVQGYRSLIEAKANYTNICIDHSHMITESLHYEDYVLLADKLYEDNHPPGKDWPHRL